MALQPHIEMTKDMVRTWVKRFPEDLTGDAVGIPMANQVLQDLPTRIEALNQVARRIYEYWLLYFVLANR